MSVKWWGAASAVTVTPRRLASRISSTAAAVETCRKCTGAPVSSASRQSRATTLDSATAGRPGMPSRLDHSPSCMCPPSQRVGSSACWATTAPGRERAYSRAWRIIPADSTHAPSSVKTRTPRACSSPIGASSTPARCLVMHPAAWTSHTDRDPAARTDATTAGSSSGGSVFGIATTAVNPPSAAARAPVSIVSASS